MDLFLSNYFFFFFFFNLSLLNSKVVFNGEALKIVCLVWPVNVLSFTVTVLRQQVRVTNSTNEILYEYSRLIIYNELVCGEFNQGCA